MCYTGIKVKQSLSCKTDNKTSQETNRANTPVQPTNAIFRLLSFKTDFISVSIFPAHLSNTTIWYTLVIIQTIPFKGKYFLRNRRKPEQWGLMTHFRWRVTINAILALASARLRFHSWYPRKGWCLATRHD